MIFLFCCYCSVTDQHIQTHAATPTSNSLSFLILSARTNYRCKEIKWNHHWDHRQKSNWHSQLSSNYENVCVLVGNIPLSRFGIWTGGGEKRYKGLFSFSRTIKSTYCRNPKLSTHSPLCTLCYTFPTQTWVIKLHFYIRFLPLHYTSSSFTLSSTHTNCLSPSLFPSLWDRASDSFIYF